MSKELQATSHSPAPFLDNKVSLWQGDITRLEIDAIVNSTDFRYSGGGGIDCVIHRAAGLTLEDECDALDACPMGQTRITSGHALPAKCMLKCCSHCYNLHLKTTGA